MNKQVKKGFKAFELKNGKLMCRDMVYKVGKTYKHDNPVMCKNGFHYCDNAFDVYNYYEKSVDTVLCEIEDLGNTLKEGDKSCTDKIKIVKRLSTKDLLKLWIKRTNSGYHNSGNYNSGCHNSGHNNSGNSNSGNYNSGHHNSGHHNSGNYNSGNYNSGYHNSGNYNSGHHNSGNSNSGHSNSGHYNSGCHNSGYHNSGYHNSGHNNSGNSNSGNYNSGFLNTDTPTVRLFNKYTKLLFDSPEIYRLKQIKVKPILQWVSESQMTEQEKSDNPSYKTTQGYLKNTGRIDYRFLTEDDKKHIKSLPGYNSKIFEEITGVKI